MVHLKHWKIYVEQGNQYISVLKMESIHQYKKKNILLDTF